MKKIKKEQGITLIALIITIIVLLILALVTINAIKGDDSLIAHAQNAGSKYTAEGENENAVVQNYLTYIDEKILGNKSNSSSDWGYYEVEDTKTILYMGNSKTLSFDEDLVIYANKYNVNIGDDSIEYTKTDETIEIKLGEIDFDYRFSIYNPETNEDLTIDEVIIGDEVGMQFLHKEFGNVKKFVFSEGITEISEEFAHNYENSIEELILPSTITIIGNSCFSNKDIATVIYNGTTSQWSAISKNYAFKSGTVITCTDGTVTI